MSSDEDNVKLSQLIHELEVHQVELESQNHQLREAQELLEQSRARYADLYDFAPLAYCTFDRAGRILELNLAAASLLGATRERLIGKPLTACVAVADKDAFWRHLGGCLDGQGSCATELTFTVPGKREIVVQIASSPHVDAEGNIAGCRSALTDVTLRQQAEDALRIAVRMREDFLAVVSHDLRNPLNAVLMGTDLLLSEAPEPVMRKQLESIGRATRRMSRLVSDLLDLSSMDAGHLSMRLQTCDLRDIVIAAVDALTPLARKKAIRLEPSLPPDALPASCDRDRIIQVFLNLGGNAIKFTPPRGFIEIGARASSDGVLCSVRDTGVGISEEQRKLIFEPYWQAHKADVHEKGAGLGLAIAKGIIDFHGGRIWAETREGGGSIFCFSLPTTAADHRGERSRRFPDHVTPLPGRVPMRRPSHHGDSILLVDDEADARDALSQILVGKGYRVSTAADGREALDFLRDSEDLPAVVLLDLMMPRMDGRAFLTERRLDRRLADMPVVLISAQPDAQQTMNEFDLAGVIAKPVSVARLVRTLQDLVT
jgi:PAS domain S-box-containing protein